MATDDQWNLSSSLAHALKRLKRLGSPNHGSTTVLAVRNPKHDFGLSYSRGGTSEAFAGFPKPMPSLQSHKEGEGTFARSPSIFGSSMSFGDRPDH